jgi:hypothetical protein
MLDRNVTLAQLNGIMRFCEKFVSWDNVYITSLEKIENRQSISVSYPLNTKLEEIFSTKKFLKAYKVDEFSDSILS